MSEIVRQTEETLPELTPEDKGRLQMLAERPESEIDLTDIPEITPEQWAKAVRGRFYRPMKQLRGAGK